MRLQAMQEQVERQMGLLSTQEGVASLGIEEEAEGLVGEQRGGHQGGGRRRSSTPLSPVLYVSPPPFPSHSSTLSFLLLSVLTRRFFSV